MEYPFRDRSEAGQLLAQELSAYAGREDVIVLALPRGGVPVAFEVARAIHAPLDVFVVRKLGVPGHEELAMGAIASGGTLVTEPNVIEDLAIPPDVVAEVAAREEQERLRREREYRGDRPEADVRGRTLILVDDGLATGSTMRAAVAALRKLQPARIVVAVPVAAASACAELAPEVDDIVCTRTPEPFYSVGQWYGEFSQTTDEEVRELLARAEREMAQQRP
jgi:predicted phosphoribosyltransferase